MFASPTSGALACLGLNGEAAAFVGRATSDKVLLAGVLALLFAGWLASRSRADRFGRALFLLSGALFVGALATRALVVPLLVFALAAVVAALLSPRVAGGEKARMGIAAGVGLALVGAAALSAAARELESGAALDPATEVRAAMAHGNLFEARLWSERWASETPDQRGEAALALAEINWGLGHRARARSLAAEVASRATDPEVQRRAGLHVTEWSEAK